MDSVVALLRAVNVGGRQLQMAQLRSRLTDLGCGDVRSYIQSGNLVLTPPANRPVDLRLWLEDNISATAAFRVPVVMREVHEINRTVADNPYPHVDPTQLHVLFFADPLPAGLLAGIDPDLIGPETWTAAGPDVYMHLPNGMGRAVLPGLIEKVCKRADLAGTARNWNTVTTLARMAREPSPQKKR